MEETAGNKKLEEAIHQYCEKQGKETIIGVLEAIRMSMHEDGEWMIPVVPPQQAFDLLDTEQISAGDIVTIEEELHFKVNHFITSDGKEWIAAFTSREELERGESTSAISQPVEDILKGSRNMCEEGIIINPWSESFLLKKDLIHVILKADVPENHIYFEICDITKMHNMAHIECA